CSYKMRITTHRPDSLSLHALFRSSMEDRVQSFLQCEAPAESVLLLGEMPNAVLHDDHGSIDDDTEVNGSMIIVENCIRHLAEERSEEHTSELKSRANLVCRLLLEI